MMMASLRHRKSPMQDAIQHAIQVLDKTAALEVKSINSFKGRGVFAKAHFCEGDFVVEYRGELRRIDRGRCAVFMFDFCWQEKIWCVDAAEEDGSFGRLVNNDHKRPNCTMKKIVTEGKPHLCLSVLRNIHTGEEITYDYGGADWPWRKQEGGKLNVTKSSEAEVSRTSDPPPQESPDSEIEEGGKLNVTKSSEAEVSRTSDPPPQESPDSEIEDSDAMRLLASEDKYKLNLPLINCTDSEEPQSSSATPDPEFCFSRLDHITIPNLRRTKSIQFYGLPEDTLQLAKISEVLMNLKLGRLAEFEGKTLGDISIDPEESVHLNSDPNEGCESDPEGSQVTSHQREEDVPPDVQLGDALPQQSACAPQHGKRQPRSPKRGRAA